MQLNELTIKEAAEGLRKKKFSAVELTGACLARIEKRNPEINSFITVCAEEALDEARRADEALARGEGGSLIGIPYSVKDAICTAGVRATASAKILDNYIPVHDATVVCKLRAAGAVLIGKTNCDAFGHGASNENSMYGPVRNPHDLSKVAGGSSGGAAASVADHQCLFAVGEDTGGSIRQPASFCGIAGVRPSYGRNSRFGIMPMASSLDVVGPMAKNMYDLAMGETVMAGHDSLDATTVPDAVPDYAADLEKSIKGLRVGVPKEYYEIEGIDSEVEAITRLKIERLKDLGAKILPVSLPHTKYALAVYYILVPSEDSSNLGRIDSIRYGVRAPADNLFDLYANSRAAGLPEEVKRRILIGTYALSAGYYDAYYKKAQQVRTLIKKDFDDVFEKVDVLITPTSPFPAFGVSEKANDPLALYLADIMVSPSAVAGMPAVSVPAEVTAAGLPVGVQLIGARMREEAIFRVGKWLEE